MAVKWSLWQLLAFISLVVSSAASRPADDEDFNHNISFQLLDKARSMRRVGDQHGEARGGVVLAADPLTPLHAIAAPRSHWHHSSYKGEPSSLVHLTLGQTTALGHKALRWGSLVHKWAFPSHVSNERWRERARSTVMMQRSTKEEEQHLATPPVPHPELQSADNPVWMSRFVVTLCLLSLATWCTASQLKVDVGTSDIGDAPSVRGRPFCSCCCAVATLLLSTVVFWFTLSVLSVEKLQYEHDHTTENGTASGADHDNSTAHLREIRNPGERAFEAGQGVALSVFVGIFMLCSWRHLNSVRIRLDLMAQFAMRGALLSSVAAGLMEVVGSMAVYAMRSELTSDTSKLKDGLNVWTMVLMMMVGISEELAKFMALLWNTWYTEDAVLQSVVDSPSHWGCMWPTLIESPHAMMLAGLSVGLGFMVVENAGYLVEVAMMAETDDKDSGDADDSDFGLRLLRVLTIIIRVALNLHPYLTGVTAARLASLLLKQPEANSAVTVTDIIWAFWFSAAVHALYDFLVVVLPGILGLFMPFLFWFLLRQHFRVWWDSFLGTRSWGDLQVRASEIRDVGESGVPGDDAPHHTEITELRDENQRLREELRSLRNSLRGSGELPRKDTMRQEEAESTTDVATSSTQIVAPSTCSDETESGTAEETKSSAS